MNFKEYVYKAQTTMPKDYFNKAICFDLDSVQWVSQRGFNVEVHLQGCECFNLTCYSFEEVERLYKEIKKDLGIIKT